MAAPENNKPIFSNLEEAQFYYTRTIEFWNDETMQFCDFVKDEITYECCKYCRKCVFDKRKKLAIERKKEKFESIRQCAIYLLINMPTGFLERQAHLKTLKLLVSNANRYNRIEGRKLKNYVKNYHSILCERQELI